MCHLAPNPHLETCYQRLRIPHLYKARLTHLPEKLRHALVDIFVRVLIQADYTLRFRVEGHCERSGNGRNSGKRQRILADRFLGYLCGRGEGGLEEGADSYYIGVMELGVTEKQLEDLKQASVSDKRWTEVL